MVVTCGNTPLWSPGPLASLTLPIEILSQNDAKISKKWDITINVYYQKIFEEQHTTNSEALNWKSETIKRYYW